MKVRYNVIGKLLLRRGELCAHPAGMEHIGYLSEVRRIEECEGPLRCHVIESIPALIKGVRRDREFQRGAMRSGM